MACGPLPAIRPRMSISAGCSATSAGTPFMRAQLTIETPWVTSWFSLRVLCEVKTGIPLVQNACE